MLDTQTRSQKIKSGSKTSTKAPTKAATKVATKAVARNTPAAKPRKARAEVRPALVAVPVQSVTPAIGADERQILIEQAAYFRAEKRGFAPGGELQDWIEAEAEVLLRIGGG
jgi:hypothetical protein